MNFIFNKLISISSSELYVTVSLCVGGKKVDSKRTSSIEKFQDQVFNQILTFEPCIKQPNVTESNLSLTVVLHSRSLADQDTVVGRAVVGPKTNEEGISHWQEMVNCARTAVAQWHRLVFWGTSVPSMLHWAIFYSPSACSDLHTETRLSLTDVYWHFSSIHC